MNVDGKFVGSIGETSSYKGQVSAFDHRLASEIVNEGGLPQDVFNFSSPWTNRFFVERYKRAEEPKTSHGLYKDGKIYPRDNRTYLLNDNLSQLKLLPRYQSCNQDLRTKLEEIYKPFIEPLVKHLDYRDAQYIIDTKDDYPPNEFFKFTQDIVSCSSSNIISSLFMKIVQILRPTQVQIDRGVSTEALALESSKGFDTLDDLEWTPQPTIELFFECPDMPTFLAHKGSLYDLIVLTFNLLGVAYDPRSVCPKHICTLDGFRFHAETASGADSFLLVDDETLPQIMSKDFSDTESWVSDLDKKMGTSLPHNEHELFNISDDIMVCLRSLIYAYSIDSDTGESNYNQCWQSDVSVKSLKDGKPNVKGRPRGKIDRVIYLPKYKKYSNKNSSNNGDSSERNYYGRLARVVKYKHDRYKKSGLQGRSVRYPMCLGRNGENPEEIFTTKYKVSKRKIPFVIDND